MKILITSIVDLKKTPHNRLHHFIKCLSQKNEITVLCINDWWKASKTNAQLYVQGSDDFFHNVEIRYYTNRKISPILQELFSFIAINRMMDLKQYDIHINYNTMLSGYYVSKKVSPTIFDVADDLPEMVRLSPQVPLPLRPFGAMLSRVVFKSNIRNARKITYITEPLKKSYDIDDSKAVLLPNGVDATHFQRKPPGEIKNKLNLGEEFVVGYVGVLREWVNMEPAIEAISSLKGKGYKVKLVIVGEEGYLKETKAIVEKHGASDVVIFAGTVPYAEVPRYVSCMDVCLVPFTDDALSTNSLPLKLFEYMACEKPVISSRLKGITNAVGDLVLYASTSDEYEEMILRLYEDWSLRVSMGQAGRSFVMGNFDWKTIESKLQETLHEVAG
jgi:Glycosyltransferase